ncbi:hypothetical protein [Caenimonas sp. SL110]|uniref:hypothetical protein n=1 Tax=Caenimonas sp. SL110 TaxID=1450524 RepID=UPI0006549B88|nr:hypothetical protein [Caenimonas sp. SL110]
MKVVGSIFVALAASSADQRETVAGASRELPGRKWTGTQIFTNESNTTYFTAPEPAPECGLEFSDPYVFGADIKEFHQFWANCSAADGSLERDSVEVFGLPNGDWYYDRREGDRSLPCELGNFSGLNPRQAIGARSVTAYEICTNAPTAPTLPTTRPTMQPSAAPTGVRTMPAQEGLSLSPEATVALSVGGGIGLLAVGAAVIGVTRLCKRRTQQQLRYVELPANNAGHEPHAQGQQVVIHVDRTLPSYEESQQAPPYSILSCLESQQPPPYPPPSYEESQWPPP